MSDQDKTNGRSLVPARRRDLAPVVAANPLLARGLADITQGRGALKRSEASPSDLKTAISHYFRGTALFREFDYIKARKEFDEAIRLFDESIRLEPNNAFTYRHRGKTCWWKSVADDMIADERLEALGRWQDFETLQKQLVKDGLSARQARQEALRRIEARLPQLPEPSATDSGNGNPPVERYSQANCGVNSNEEDYYEKAMKDFDEAIRLDPNNAIAYVERGEAWFWGFGHDEWIKDFNEAIRIDPNNAGWYALRGLAWLQNKDYDKAIQDLNEAIRLNPSQQADVLIAFTSTEEQEALYTDDYHSGNPTLSGCIRINLYYDLEIAYRQRGQVWFTKRDYDKAIKDFDEAVHLHLKNVSAYVSASDRLHAALYCDCGEAWAWYGKIKDFDHAIRQREQRLEKLRMVSAPEIILQNELRSLSRLEDARRNAMRAGAE